MVGLRTVTVLEHEEISVIKDRDVPGIMLGTNQWLSETDARALLHLNGLRPGFCRRLPDTVKLAQYCGIVRLPTCVVEVLPKIGMGDARDIGELEHSRAALLTMLHSAQNVTIKKVGPVPQQAVKAPLLDVFITAFLYCALEQARRGLLSRYVPHVDDLPVMKGRLKVHGQVRRNLMRPHLLHCEYDDFTPDNTYNRAVRATLEVCRPWISRASTHRLWLETHTRFYCASAVKVSAADVARLPRDRTSHRYHALLTWCEWLLALASPALSAGVSAAPGLLFDMNELFEAHVANIEGKNNEPERIVSRHGPRRHLASHGEIDLFELKPDITVGSAGKDGAPASIDRIVDAKWKRVSPSETNYGVQQADVYQLLAYAIRYDCASVELAYPMPVGGENVRPPPVFKLDAPSMVRPVTLTVKLVPFWRPVTSESFRVSNTISAAAEH